LNAALRQLASLLLALATLSLDQAPAIAAGDLADVVSDLWGGDGITLDIASVQDPSEILETKGFETSSLTGFGSLQSQLAANLNFLSVSSTASGFTFDLELGVPVRTTDSFGPLIAERANTLGRSRLNVALSYTRLDYQRFQGDRLDDLELVFENDRDFDEDGEVCDPDTPSLFQIECDHVRVDLDVELEQDVVALFGRYGITARWDVGFVAPFVHSRARATGDATIVYADPSHPQHRFGPLDRSHSSASGTASGLGDVLLQTKYHLREARGAFPDLGVLGQVKLATGDEDDLLGTGETNFLLLLIASRTWRWLTPHLNLGYEVSTGPAELDNLRYTSGIDARLLPNLTAALDVVGRFGPNADARSDHLADLGTGIKWEVFRSLLLDVNLLFPLNRNEGLRTNVTWTVGFEYTFDVE